MALRQCPKRLWLEIHRPELREDSAATQASFNIGFQVGDIARQIYDPEGAGAMIDIESEGFDQAFERTKALLQTPQPVFEAGFSANGALAFADVMRPQLHDGQLVWHMVEVKSSTSVKDYHHDDVAVQSYVARAAGVPLVSVALAHIDSSWIYPGDGDYRGLLKENDLTAEAFARGSEVESWIAQAQQVAAADAEPEEVTGDQCWAPFECGFHGYCSRNAPKPEYPVHWLPRISADKVRMLANQGVTDMRDVPDIEFWFCHHVPDDSGIWLFWPSSGESILFASSDETQTHFRKS